MKGDRIKLMCGKCGERVGTAQLGPTPNGGHAWSVTTRTVIEGARPDRPSDWVENGFYVDPNAPFGPVSVLTCPCCGADLKLVLEDLEKSGRIVLVPY